MNNKKKKKNIPKQLHHRDFHAIDEYLLNELSPLPPRFSFQRLPRLAGEDRPGFIFAQLFPRRNRNFLVVSARDEMEKRR